MSSSSVKAAWSGGMRSELDDRNVELGTDYMPPTDLLVKLRGGLSSQRNMYGRSFRKVGDGLMETKSSCHICQY